MPTSENLKRVVVSIAGIPVILLASYLGGYCFFIFVAVISLVSFYEFSLLTKYKGANVNLPLGELIILILLLNQFQREVNALIEDVRAQARFTKRVKRLIKEYVQITGFDPPPPLYEVKYRCEKRLEAIQDQAHGSSGGDRLGVGGYFDPRFDDQK